MTWALSQRYWTFLRVTVTCGPRHKQHSHTCTPTTHTIIGTWRQMMILTLLWRICGTSSKDSTLTSQCTTGSSFGSLLSRWCEGIVLSVTLTWPWCFIIVCVALFIYLFMFFVFLFWFLLYFYVTFFSLIHITSCVSSSNFFLHNSIQKKKTSQKFLN